MGIAQVDSVADPTDVTPALLSELLQCKVTSCQFNALGKGVMSNVQLLTVCYDGHDSGNRNVGRLPTQFIAKFKKTEIPLPDLFSVEGAFYRLSESISESHLSADSHGEYHELADASVATTADKPQIPFSFRIAKAVATGPSWLLLELIPPNEIDTFEVHEGCPPNVLDDLVIRLARMHLFFWMDSESIKETSQRKKLAVIFKNHSRYLSSSPGTGHTLPIDSRQDQFLPSWPAVRERLTRYIERDDLHRMDNIVDLTATDCRIQKCATRVTQRKYTMVHGDFHIGNILFPKEGRTAVHGCEESCVPWLVDWSMVGLGNPLIDLVFFLVVGANDIHIHQEDASTTSKHLERILRLYYTSLNDQKPTEFSTMEPDQSLLLSWDEFVSMFRECLLNQFIILVCYDTLCRDMADAFPCDEKDVYHDHFDRVNVRCVRMLLSDHGWTENMLD
ncbi:hypothetical protein ACHAWX_003860 [Stephanocyclus meneghinianus]